MNRLIDWWCREVTAFGLAMFLFVAIVAVSLFVTLGADQNNENQILKRCLDREITYSVCENIVSGR